ncbi:hypothetical protein K435DRAFT_971386 [Dendrothele bispora CBS 962.96]|uniref:Uncharacterized protein n=1 Tax=Dendrothele bispora (strain CBS 962.96) TaxID=1314807 RepID=A0A4S8L623_DENBC|nr:hypothetical protein K435DRAFT_971386 [Dendrothele bispora CBS 962.96]
MLVTAQGKNHPFFLLLCLPSLVMALDNHRRWPSFPFLWKRASRNVPEQGFYDPRDHGGSWLTVVDGTFPPGQGEPINMIISGNSDEAVLQDREEDGGLRNYWLSLEFAGECLGQHSGSDQGANLGDGNGAKNETAVIRFDYGQPQLGTCQETINGGNHFRYWVQDGDDANSGAIFMAVSYEMPIARECVSYLPPLPKPPSRIFFSILPLLAPNNQLTLPFSFSPLPPSLLPILYTVQHDIIPNGYNLARDYIVGNITQSPIPTLSLTNSTTYSGSTSFEGWTYQTDVIYLSGMLDNTSIGINHNVTVQTGSSNASDGLVALLTVKVTGKPDNGAFRDTSAVGPSGSVVSAVGVVIVVGGIRMVGIE